MSTTFYEPPAAPPAENPLPDLTVKDRCDRCTNSQAYVRVRLRSGGSDLLFCGHHFAKHESALAVAGAEIRDERARLLVSYLDVEATELAK